MKTVKQITVQLIAAFMLLAGTTFAQDGFSGLYISPVENAKKADFTIVNSHGEEMELIIRGIDGASYFTEYISADENVYRKRFNLTQLRSGKYKVQLKNETSGEMISSKSIKLAGDALAVMRSEKQNHDVPYHISYQDGKLVFSYHNKNQETFKIEIRDNKGNLVYKHNFGDEFAISKKFDLTDLWPGQYNITLASENQKFCSTIKK